MIKYTVFTGCRNGLMPDSDDYAEFETIKELREYLRELKSEFSEDNKVSVIYPLSKLTTKSIKAFGGMPYFEYSPIDASSEFLPYSVYVEYVAPNYCPKCGEHFFVHENGCVED